MLADTNTITKESTDVNQELEAMGSIAKALDKLDNEARERVLQWAANRYISSMVQGKVVGLHNPKASGNHLLSANQPTESKMEFADLPSLFEAANPTTEPEKALVLGYWYQKMQGESDFGSQTINTELKHLGHAVKNITAAFTSLINNKLVLQIKKSGNSQQARKRYKLTLTGMKKVEEMIKQVAEA